MSISSSTQQISALQQQAIQNARSAFKHLHDGDALLQQSINQANTVSDILDLISKNYRTFKGKRSTRALQRLQQHTMWLQNFSGVVDVVVQTSAEIGCPLWAPIKLVLQISKYHTLVVEQIVSMMLVITDSLPRFQLYEKLEHDPVLHIALLNVFTDIVEFALRVSLYFRHNAIARLIRVSTTSMKEELCEIVSRLETHARILDHTAVAAELVRASTFRSEINSRDLEDLNAKLNQLLRPYDNRRLQDIHIQSRLQGTCQWIWTHTTFLQWSTLSAQSMSDRVLYISGTHGCGKTILASSIVEGLGIRGYVVFYFSFSATETSRGTIDDLARSMLWQAVQMITIERCSDIIRSLLSHGSPLTSELWKAYTHIATMSTTPTIWVIDGLDECEESIQPMVQQIESILVSHRSSKFVLVGRPHLLPKLKNVGLTIDITPDLIKDDVKNFIEKAATSAEILNRPELRGHVISTLQDKTDGMFLWAKLMAEDLRKSSSNSEVMERLEHLPHGLEKAYHLLLSRMIQKLDRFELRLAYCALNLIIAAPRPLRLQELQYAQALKIQSYKDPQNQQPLMDHFLHDIEQRLLYVCGGLIYVTGGVVRLVHLSAKEYLTRPGAEWLAAGGEMTAELRVQIPEAHASFSCICLDYLEIGGYGFPLRDSLDMISLRPQFPLLDYACRYLIHHCNESMASSNTAFPQITQFLTRSGCIPWLEYITVLLMNNEFDTPLTKELSNFGYHLDQKGRTDVLVHLRSQIQEELFKRQELYGTHDFRTEQWASVTEIFEADIIGHIEFLSDLPPIQYHKGSSDGVHRMIRLFNDSILSSGSQQAGFFLTLHHHLLTLKEMTDPLKVLFRLILDKSARIPAYALLNAAQFYGRLEKYDNALEILNAASDRIGDEHVLIKYLIFHEFGYVYSRKANYPEAEQYFRQAAEGQERLRGINHNETLNTLYWLGHILGKQGKHREAETIYERVAEGRKLILGSTHQDTLESLHMLGFTLNGQKNFREAEEIYRFVVENRISRLGPKHENTLLSLNNLACALRGQWKYLEAREIFESVVKDSEETLGSTHKTTLLSLYNLGWALCDEEKFEEAEKIFERVVEGRKETLGATHEETLMAMERLDYAREKAGRNLEN